jgi:hypothetical protein
LSYHSNTTPTPALSPPPSHTHIAVYKEQRKERREGEVKGEEDERRRKATM